MALEKAADTDPDTWMAHNLLANAYLKQKNFEGAGSRRSWRSQKGKTGANTANLPLGQALAGLGKKEEGIQALKTFIQNSPKDTTVPQVRDMIAKLEQSGTGLLGER